MDYYIVLTLNVTDKELIDWTKDDLMISYAKLKTSPLVWNEGEYCNKSQHGSVQCKLFEVIDLNPYEVQLSFTDKAGVKEIVPVDDYYVPKDHSFDCYSGMFCTV